MFVVLPEVFRYEVFHADFELAGVLNSVGASRDNFVLFLYTQE